MDCLDCIDGDSVLEAVRRLDEGQEYAGVFAALRKELCLDCGSCNRV